MKPLALVGNELSLHPDPDRQLALDMEADYLREEAAYRDSPAQHKNQALCVHSWGSDPAHPERPDECVLCGKSAYPSMVEPHPNREMDERPQTMIWMGPCDGPCCAGEKHHHRVPLRDTLSMPSKLHRFEAGICNGMIHPNHRVEPAGCGSD